MKEQEQDREEIFGAGTILADLNNAQRNAAADGGRIVGGKSVSRKTSGRKPGEPLVTLSPKERPVVERSGRPSISGGGGGGDLARSGTRGGSGGAGGAVAASAASSGADLVRSNTRGTAHLPLVSVDVHRKATTRSTRTAGTTHTGASNSGMHSKRDAEVHSASSTGTLNDEHDLLSTFRATGHGDLGLGSGFSNNVPVSSVVRVEDDDTATVLSTSFPASGGSLMDDFAASFPQQQSSRSGGRARQSGELSLAGGQLAEDHRVTATRSGTVKSHMSKRSISRSGSQSKPHRPHSHHRQQREPSSPVSTSPPRTSAYLLPQIDTTDVSLGAVSPTSPQIPSPPPYSLASDLALSSPGAAGLLGRQASARSDRERGGSSSSRPGGGNNSATGVGRSRSTRSRAASIYDDEDEDGGNAYREREAARAAADASSRRRRSSRSRTREGTSGSSQPLSPPAHRLPRSPAESGTMYRDEEYEYADDESSAYRHQRHNNNNNNTSTAPSVARTRSTRVGGGDAASLSATGVKRSGTGRSTRHHESSNASGSAGGVSRSASNAKHSTSATTSSSSNHRVPSTRGRRPQEPASDDETPLASVALQALQQSLGGGGSAGVSGSTPPASSPMHRRPSKVQQRRRDVVENDDEAEEDVPLGQLARQASVNGTEIVRIDH
ncbi:hypothetical protein HDU86_001625 [Geranomyces michiganensis]|nr:hypothetical protein HDU86_001625 [Geranomyces michiganensis]